MAPVTENYRDAGARDTEQILSGIRIVELGTDVAAAYAARLCAIYGADVITVEPPEGHPVRHLPPWVGGSKDPAKSILFAYLGMGKRSLCLDMSAPDDTDRVRELILGANGVFDSYPPGRLAELGIDLDRLADMKRTLSVTRISPYGQTGPRANWAASALTAAAAGGQLYLAGDADRPPMLTAGHQAHYQTGIQAFGGMLTSLYAAAASGTGELLDLSIQEVQATSLEAGGPAALWHGGDQTRSGNCPRAMWGIHQCKDGWVGVSAMSRQTHSVLDAMGLGELKGDPLFTPGGQSPEANELLSQLIPDFMMSHTAEEIFELADEFRAPIGLIPTPAQLLEWPHHRETGFWQEADHPLLGRHAAPSGPIEFDGQDRGRSASAPTQGQHTGEILSELAGAPRSTSAEAEDRDGARTLALPYSGLRVIDMTQVWSGPYGARFLADMGAEVIKVEGPTFPDPIRTAGGNRTTPEIDLSSYFNEYNRGKKSLTLDIKQAQGLEALRRLIGTSDVFIENWSSGVAERNGLGYQEVATINPAIIYVSMPGFGHRGRDSTRVGFGPTIEQMGGLVAVQGYAGGPPHRSGISYGDPIAGSACAAAVAACLLRRQRTGQGAYCMIPQRDGVTSLIGEYFVAESLGCPMPVRQGMAHPTSAPHNVYPTLPDEEPRPVLGPDRKPVSHVDDRWIAIDCRTDAEWGRLATVIGDPRLSEGRFTTTEGRRERLDYIEEVIAEWTSDQDPVALAERLQAAGVNAAPVMSPLLLIEDPHLIDREFYITVEHEVAGAHRTTRPTWRLQRRPHLPVRSGPAFGADSRDILESLGYTPDEIDSMTGLGVTSRELLGGS
jgi:crotonobetainyl-CoA:carnitine CoA-transferase CaiB-like acyl-CoA transferase